MNFMKGRPKELSLASHLPVPSHVCDYKHCSVPYVPKESTLTKSNMKTCLGQ